MLLTLVGSIFADNLTVSEIELKAGNSQDVAISLINASKKYTAFQFDIVLPEGISIAKNDKGKLMATLNEDRIDDHTLTIQELGSNTYRFLCFSLTNAEFSPRARGCQASRSKASMSSAPRTRVLNAAASCP